MRYHGIIAALFAQTQRSLASFPTKPFGLTAVRGGAETTENVRRPSWLSMDRETLEKYMAMARERHQEAVEAARDAYWSHDNEESNMQSSQPTIEMDTHQIIPPLRFRLPDFSDGLDTRVFVTHGASASANMNSSTPLFTPQELDLVIQSAQDHFDKRHGGEWTKLPSGQYDVAGFWIKDVPEVHSWFNRMVKERLFPLLARQYPEFCTVKDLVVDNAYLFKYTTETGKRTGVHTDSGCLSFTIAVGGDYEGGGTWFEGLQDTENSVLEMTRGHVTIRPGGVRHCGNAVTAGTRYIIGGFCMHKSKVEHVRMLIGLGSELAKEGKYAQAQEALEASLAINSGFDGAYTHLADVLEKQGKTQQAMQVLEYCYTNVNPLNGEVAYTLGVMYMAQQKYQRARECFETCIKVDDMDESAMLALAKLCECTGDKDGERKWYEATIQIPGLPKEAAASAYSNLGVLHEGQDEEIEYYKKALELIENFECRYSLASALATRKEWKPATESFQIAVELAPNDQLEAKALNALYHASVQHVQTLGATTQETMMQQLYATMGEANYKKLAATRAQ